MNPPLYNIIGFDYNTTRQADPYIAGRLHHWLAPQPDGLYLDIGCGTGNYTTWLANRGVTFYGIDPSETMLIEAANRSLATSETNRIHWLTGTADTIPAANQLFDGAIATLTIHHWPDMSAAFSEIGRVLKPGAILVIFTATPEQMRAYWLNLYFPEMLRDSMSQMPSLERIAEEASDFTILAIENYFVEPDLKDLFLYAGKHRPELYLDPVVRKGISSFAALANGSEVNQGLARLRADIDTGIFEDQKATVVAPEGDYLFVVMLRN